MQLLQTWPLVWIGGSRIGRGRRDFADCNRFHHGADILSRCPFCAALVPHHGRQDNCAIKGKIVCNHMRCLCKFLLQCQKKDLNWFSVCMRGLVGNSMNLFRFRIPAHAFRWSNSVRFGYHTRPDRSLHGPHFPRYTHHFRPLVCLRRRCFVICRQSICFRIEEQQAWHFSCQMKRSLRRVQFSSSYV